MSSDIKLGDTVMLGKNRWTVYLIFTNGTKRARVKLQRWNYATNSYQYKTLYKDTLVADA